MISSERAQSELSPLEYIPRLIMSVTPPSPPEEPALRVAQEPSTKKLSATASFFPHMTSQSVIVETLDPNFQPP
eukprot:2940937-Rhodomonas_salina.2